MSVKNYRDLLARQKAMDLVELVYHLTQTFPSQEQFGLTSQLRRAAVSVPSNITEGQGRRAPREFHRFLGIAHGSLREVETQVLIARRLKIADEAGAKEVLDLASEIGRLITGLCNYLESEGQPA